MTAVVRRAESGPESVAVQAAAGSSRRSQTVLLLLGTALVMVLLALWHGGGSALPAEKGMDVNTRVVMLPRVGADGVEGPSVSPASGAGSETAAFVAAASPTAAAATTAAAASATPSVTATATATATVTSTPTSTLIKATPPGAAATSSTSGSTSADYPPRLSMCHKPRERVPAPDVVVGHQADFAKAEQAKTFEELRLAITGRPSLPVTAELQAMMDEYVQLSKADQLKGNIVYHCKQSASCAGLGDRLRAMRSLFWLAFITKSNFFAHDPDATSIFHWVRPRLIDTRKPRRSMTVIRTCAFVAACRAVGLCLFHSRACVRLQTETTAFGAPHISAESWAHW